ncbi:hypothetical protein QTL97_11180 [Sporosarcina thermotolerans]|uniref:Lipoprotein n=1 Tax=Sporosarcina thermotolerans TaxID=633404 RepID=A0AAW9A932_9BACL|nr:hypothetical protein [Sporosarcina thermotolerans]MDW0117500.1 hypothetical protein [Sporosarcina thermotolerans]WHT49668.1 hypothetical protein QNH10_09320 [Sporosarcina thermotolerans]
MIVSLGGIRIKRYIPILLLLLSAFVSACSQNVEDTEEYYGFIGGGKAMGYEFTITKEELGSFLWEIGYKGDLIVLEEDESNIDDLLSYANAIHDVEATYSTVFYSVIYFLLVAAIFLFLFVKNRKVLKSGGAIAIVLAGGISLYFALDTSIDLNRAMQEAKLYYLRLVE